MIEFCGGYISREWKCSECGYMWQTEHWDDNIIPVNYPPKCPNCEENK